jgi:hypothetical protein
MTSATLVEAPPTSARRTIPYDGHEGRADTIRAKPLEGQAIEPGSGGGDYVDDSPEEPFVDERDSDVRLRIGRLSPEWYKLLDARAG